MSYQRQHGGLPADAGTGACRIDQEPAAAGTHWFQVVVNEVRLLDQAGSQGQLIYSRSIPFDYVQGDGDRLWFGGSREIYLYSPNRGFQKVFAYDADPATANRIEPPGFCR